MKKSNQQKIVSAQSDQQKTLLQFWRNNSANNLNMAKSSNDQAKSTTTSSSSTNYFQAKSNTKKQKSANTTTSKDQLILIDDGSSNPYENLNKNNGDNNYFTNGLANNDFDYSAAVANIDDDDDNLDDLELIQTTETFLKEKSFNRTSFSCFSNASALENSDNNGDKLTLGIEDELLLSTQHSNTSGFDQTSGQVWIYPNNMAVRSYQYNIIEKCLYKNTMVVLPTGMGKTFIAGNSFNEK